MRAAIAWIILEGAWLTPERVRVFVRMLLVVTLAGVGGWLAFSQGLTDPTGKPLGGDFVSFWTASQLALADPAAPYSVTRHLAAERALFPHLDGYAAFFYPPTYLLICLPLALAPFLWALAGWVLIPGAAYVAAVRAFAGRALGWAPILAFPALVINAGNGQNGFLSGALIGGGAVLLRRRPILAGVCFGLMAFKPHLALMIPVALIAARRWSTLASAAATSIAFSGATLLLWGPAPWRGFFAGAALARETLERNLVGDDKMQSLFAALRLWGVNLDVAYGAQALLALIVAVALVRLQRREFRGESEGAALVSACGLASPFMLDYDLTLLAFPLAFLARRGLEHGFRPGEKVALALGFVLPLITRNLAHSIGLPLTPFVTLAIFAYVFSGRAAPAMAPAQPEAWTRLPTAKAA